MGCWGALGCDGVDELMGLGLGLGAEACVVEMEGRDGIEVVHAADGEAIVTK